LQNAKNDARARVKELIQNVIPEYIRHLNDILEAAETDSSSALWKGHLKTGLFVKDNVKLVYNNAQKRQLGLGTASIAPEGTDGDDAVARQRWEGGLEQNVICDRLNAIVEEYVANSRFPSSSPLSRTTLLISCPWLERRRSRMISVESSITG
jgi:hypothetical protein